MNELRKLALSIRKNALRMVWRAKASHIGSALSICDLMAVLYGKVMLIDHGNPHYEKRDRFILSKGHACGAVYATLAEVGLISFADLETYGDDYSSLMNHVSHKVPGVEFSTGSLGHGLPFSVGKALASKIQKLPWKVYVILSDGELDEGSNWEAFMFAAHHKLSNLIAIIDYNKLQSLDSVDNTLRLEPLAEKLRAFGCFVKEIDGHNHDAIYEALINTSSSMPNVILAHTVKGKGVSFMENKVEWHYKNPSDDELKKALIELGEANA